MVQSPPPEDDRAPLYELERGPVAFRQLSIDDILCDVWELYLQEGAAIITWMSSPA